MKRITSILLLTASLVGLISTNANAAVSATPEQARALAKEAYLYGFPMVESYKTLYSQAVDKTSPDFKATFNQIANEAQVFTPADKSIITPNSDTPYSFVWMDLRDEPIVLTLPKTDPKRYVSVQLIDMYTFNFAYLGNRATGTDGGNFLIAGPNWKGKHPKDITKVIRSETEFAYALYRTQLFGPKDIDNVKQLQAGYKVQTLSDFLGQRKQSTIPAPLPDFPKYDAASAHGLGFFSYMNFLLQFTPTNPSEVAMFKRFQKIGIEAGKPFDPTKLSPEIQQALLAGIKDADAEFVQFKKEKLDTHKVHSGAFFGTREFLKNNYLYRYTGARLGIFGNSQEEALYTGFFVDADNQPLDTSKNNYVIHFPKDQLPPANAFWSVTMYDGKTQLLIDNPLNRYLINSPMLSQLKRDADGGLTLYVQYKNPGKDKEANWLPAPNGPFYAVLRLYLPKAEAINGTWAEPVAVKVK